MGCWDLFMLMNQPAVALQISVKKIVGSWKIILKFSAQPDLQQKLDVAGLFT